MSKLEDSIIDKVYKVETVHTVREIIFKVVGIIVLALGAFFLGQIIWSSLEEQQTFDLLQIFHEDISVIQVYLGNVLETVYYEIPHVTVVLLLIICALLLMSILIFVRKFGKIRNRVKSLLRYWKH